jgi:uracil-DNA glycosylase family 4
MDDLSFLVQEYFNVWEFWGIEDLNPFRGKKAEIKVRQQLGPDAQKSVSSLDEVRTWIGDCKRCALCEGRKNIVFGAGSPRAALMFVGEGPGAEEDAEGQPFVGRAGKLLTKIIEAMGYPRDQVYIANVVKCRPPGNRVPSADEVDQCTPFLKTQIDLIKPKVIVALGAQAASVLISETVNLSSLRGKLNPLVWNAEIPVMATYHPAYLLRNPSAKRYVWDDMKIVKSKLETV